MVSIGRCTDTTNSAHRLLQHYIHNLFVYILVHLLTNVSFNHKYLLFKVPKRHIWILVVNHVVKEVLLRIARDVSPRRPCVDDPAYFRNQSVPLFTWDFPEEPPVPVGCLLAVRCELLFWASLYVSHHFKWMLLCKGGNSIVKEAFCDNKVICTRSSLIYSSVKIRSKREVKRNRPWPSSPGSRYVYM